MNVFTAIMLGFAVIGMVDKLIGGRFGLAQSVDKGLDTMGGMAIPTVGMCCVGTALIQNHVDGILKVMEPFPFDPSMFAGVLLAPDLGGWFISEQLASNEGWLVFNGAVLGAILGQFISYQLPVFLAMLDKSQHPAVLKGFMIGIAVIPAGLIAAGLMLKVEMGMFIAEFVPMLVICVILTLGLLKFPERIVKVFSVFASVIQAVMLVFFLFTVLGIFIPALEYASADSVHQALVILIRAAIIIGGSMVMSELVLKYFRGVLQKIADKLGVNEVAVIGMLLNFATSLAVIPLLPKMDEKGKMMNCAFSVSGAYMIGGQMGFVSSVTDGFGVTVMILSKFVCGILSMIVMYKLYDRLKSDV